MVKQQNSWAPLQRRFASYAYGLESYLKDPEKHCSRSCKSYMKDLEKSRADSAAQSRESYQERLGEESLKWNWLGYILQK